MSALPTTTASTRGASARTRVTAALSPMTTSTMPVLDAWPGDVDPSNQVNVHCTEFMGIYGVKRVATGRLGEDLT